jgi:hypothetical protein
MTTRAELIHPFLADPERQAEDARRQEVRRASFSRARLTPAERVVARGMRIEEAARASMKSPHSRGGNREQHLRQLAHGLHLQGRHFEAAEVAPDAVAAEHYAAVHDAILRDDKLCECPRREVKDPLTGADLEISPRRHLKDVYSPQHKGVVSLMSCDECRALNARPLTGQAAEIAANVGAGKLADPRQVRRDVHVLRKR